MRHARALLNGRNPGGNEQHGGDLFRTAEEAGVVALESPKSQRLRFLVNDPGQGSWTVSRLVEGWQVLETGASSRTGSEQLRRQGFL